MALREDASRVLWYDDPKACEVAQAGGKNAAFAQMVQALKVEGMRFPEGFLITAGAYREFLREHDLEPKIQSILASMDRSKPEHLAICGEEIRHLILKSPLSEQLVEDIREAYQMLCRATERSPVDVAVRSSATAEDLPTASFAGQQETYLHVMGDEQLVKAVHRCFASLYTDRAISYRWDQGFTDVAISLSVGVQEMIRSDLGSSGVMFTLDTETGFRDVILINGSYGLGEAIVGGSVNPDEYYVFKPTLKTSSKPILRKKKGQKAIKVIYDEEQGFGTKTVPTSPDEQSAFAVSDQDILNLAFAGLQIEAHFSKIFGRSMPMDIEWAKDGRTGEVFILQARPETVHAPLATGQDREQEITRLEVLSLPQKSRLLLEGVAVGEKIASGRVCVVSDVQELTRLKHGDVLVTDRTDPDWEPFMRLASGIITNRGGRTCHAAIVSRELGVPAIVGTQNGTDTLTEGQEVTLSCAEGDVGKVYEGVLPIKKECLEIDEKTAPLTAVMLNVANPEEAFHLAKIPNDGVGLARIEFIIAHSIKVHPMALLSDPKDLAPEIYQQIKSMTAGYESPAQYFVDRLAEGIGIIAAAFYPKPVIVRFSDFKTGEYAHLLGGEKYEPKEANPMLGFRGASRYYSENYRLGFGLECQAILKVRRDMGLSNVAVMVPFCRTLAEGRKVLREMERHGLKRGQDGLLAYVMCEIPSNVILAQEFAEIFDGFSIGSNDLTQLILGIDRDSELLGGLFDERNEAVTAMIEMAIKAAHKKHRPIGICGQAPSDYPDFAAFLVHQGIDSISLNPDVALKMRQRIVSLEHTLEKTTQASQDSPKGRIGGRHRWRKPTRSSAFQHL